MRSLSLSQLRVDEKKKQEKKNYAPNGSKKVKKKKLFPQTFFVQFKIRQHRHREPHTHPIGKLVSVWRFSGVSTERETAFKIILRYDRLFSLLCDVCAKVFYFLQKLLVVAELTSAIFFLSTLCVRLLAHINVRVCVCIVVVIVLLLLLFALESTRFMRECICIMMTILLVGHTHKYTDTVCMRMYICGA